MKRIAERLRVFSLFVIILSFIAGALSLSWAEDSDRGCGAAKARWESVVEELKNKLAEYKAVQATPLTRVTGHPLVSRNVDKPIAAQIAEAIRQKEELLGRKRRECYGVLTQEEEAYRAFKECVEEVAAGRKRRRALKRLASKRSRLVKRARVALAEVREVEGKEQYYPQYVDYWRSQPNWYNNRGAQRSDPWEYYRRLYRGYYGQ